MHVQIKDQVKDACHQYALSISIYENDSKFFINTSMACFLRRELNINLFISSVTFA